jgi:hypothetical protein
VRSGGFSAPLCETEFPFRDRDDEVGRLSRTFRDTLERLKRACATLAGGNSREFERECNVVSNVAPRKKPWLLKGEPECRSWGAVE